ncbi:MAG: antitermination protein NusG [Candidatus Thiodiazotropha sp. (ex Dulcina madagascariensis)]|nr:antitermination protein NusG [Candidatus Thiodiazotropha sp. (ex Dulcina madagascariensis)]
MISKILLTLTVIAVAWLVIRNRQQRLPTPSSDAGPSGVSGKPNSLIRWGGYALLVMMLLGSGMFLFLQWQDSYRVVTVRVIDTQSGRSVSYSARRADVGDRRFLTLDGREVNVANSERIELESTPNQQFSTP